MPQYQCLGVEGKKRKHTDRTEIGHTRKMVLSGNAEASLGYGEHRFLQSAYGFLDLRNSGTKKWEYPVGC